MAWSTRELAELAGTTLNTVRYYHRQGLLDEPTRSSNGYKRYGVEHLVRLLQIRRLREIGVPVAELRRSALGVGTSPEVLEAIDAELAERITQNQRTRAEIRELLAHETQSAVPAGFAEVASGLSPSEQSLMLIYAQIYDAETMEDIREIAAAGADAASRDFAVLPEDADEATRAELAERFAETITRMYRKYRWISDPASRLRQTPLSTAVTLGEAMRSMNNAAQLDVLQRAATITQSQVDSSVCRGDPAL